MEGSPLLFEMNNTLVLGSLTTSNVSFYQKDHLRGYVFYNFTDFAAITVKHIFQMMSAPNTWSTFSYVSAKFNSKTHVGKSVTGTAQGDSMMGVTAKSFELAFSNEAILKRATDFSTQVAAPEECMDFSFAARVLIGVQYNLYNANDGSTRNFQQGFPVKHKFAEYTEPTDAYVSFWGMYPSYGQLADGSMEATDSKWVDGLTVTKQNYDAEGTSTDYTLKKVNARMTKISRKVTTLDAIKKLILQVDDWRSGKSFTISWNGVKLNMVGETQGGCMYVGGGNGFNPYTASFELMDSSVGTITQSKCSCLSTSPSPTPTPHTLRTSGARDNNYFYMQMGNHFFDNEVEFLPKQSQFPQGISVRTESGTLNGLIALEYETIQTLYGVTSGSYTAGDVVVQASSGATGVVYENTKARIYGLECADNQCVTYFMPSYSSCAPMSSGSIIGQVPPGALLTQVQ